MPIKASCSNCDRQYNLNDRFAGQRVTCKECGQPFEVPRPVSTDDDLGGFLLAELDAPRRAPPSDEAPPAPAQRWVPTFKAPKVARKRKKKEGWWIQSLRWKGFNAIIAGAAIIVLPMFGLRWKRHGRVIDVTGEWAWILGGGLIVIGIVSVLASRDAD